MISKNAKLYWIDSEDTDKNRKTIYEYLVQLPIVIEKEISLKEINEKITQKEIKNNNALIVKITTSIWQNLLISIE